MAISLQKGQKISLAKVAADAGVPSLSKIHVGLYWDELKFDGGVQHTAEKSDDTAGQGGNGGKDQSILNALQVHFPVYIPKPADIGNDLIPVAHFRSPAGWRWPGSSGR